MRFVLVQRAVKAMIGTCVAALSLALARSSQAGDVASWDSLMDEAYVFSSEDPAAMAVRLEHFGRDVEIPFQAYVQTLAISSGLDAGEERLRRSAIAHLLDHLAHGRPDALERSLVAVHSLQPRLRRFENRYWYHYVEAHHALAHNDRGRFVQNALALWLHIVVPLESAREARDKPPAEPGFEAALPYVYEDLARLILFQSRSLTDRDLEPLSPIVTQLAQDRVGAFPEVIPRELSSVALLEYVNTRRAGPDSDDGSLTFVMACLDAEDRHAAALGALQEGRLASASPAVQRALAAYDATSRRAVTAAGRATLQRESLQLLTEYYRAAGSEALALQDPVRIETAMRLHAELRAAPAGLGPLGFRRTGLEGHQQLTRGLWGAIENASLGLADAHLRRAAAVPAEAPALARAASRIAGRLLASFVSNAPGDEARTIPEGATFTAAEAARLAGDALLAFTPAPSAAEIDEGMENFAAGLALFPFDPRAWRDLARLLQRHGREAAYPDLVKPIAARVSQSLVLDSWLSEAKPESEALWALRQSMSDPQLLVYLGFASDESTASLDALRSERDVLRARLGMEPVAAAKDLPPAAPDGSALAHEPGWSGPVDPQVLGARLRRSEARIAALERLRPGYDEALAADGLAEGLRGDRIHPVHVLLRRMFEENHLRGEPDR